MRRIEERWVRQCEKERAARRWRCEALTLGAAAALLSARAGGLVVGVPVLTGNDLELVARDDLATVEGRGKEGKRKVSISQPPPKIQAVAWRVSDLQDDSTTGNERAVHMPYGSE